MYLYGKAVNSGLGPLLNAYLGPYLCDLHNGWNENSNSNGNGSSFLGGVDLEKIGEIGGQGTRGCMKGFALNRRSEYWMERVSDRSNCNSLMSSVNRSRERLDAAVCCNFCT